MKYPSMSILNYRHLIFDKEAKKHMLKKRKDLQKWCWEN